MIYCIKFADFVAFVEALGFAQFAETEVSLVYFRHDDEAALTVRRPNDHGDITEQAALAACDAAEIKPPDFDVHWCD